MKITYPVGLQYSIRFFKSILLSALFLIAVSFLSYAQPWTITTSAGSGGSITPSGSVVVNEGSSQTFTMSPATGYHVSDVLVDGSSVGAVATYTFINVTEPHTITASFIKAVGVLNVTIPNATMKIGDVISATIKVINDAGIPYTYLSGNVGGYPLYGFQRINATTYLANFVIVEGGNSYPANQAIPVSNLIITDGTIQSLPYNTPIIQNNDLLDAEIPVIQSMSVESGMKKIGDVVVLNIIADGLNYSIHPSSSINGILVSAANVSFSELGGGNYRIRYIVEQGDNDVGTGELNTSVILVKPSGNIGLPYSVVTNTGQLSIDAHPPVITRMEVSSGEVGVGGTVRVAISADGVGYSAKPGTFINGIPLSSSRVSFTERTGGLYELSYIVAASDGEVAPGNLQVRMVMSDPAGNNSEAYSKVESNNLEIYTELPTAVIAGTLEICEEQAAELSIFLQGRGPWSFDLFDGTNTTTYEEIVPDNYTLTVTPARTTTYNIPSIRDINGVENTGSGDVQVTVFEKTYVEIINLASGYSVEADPFKLEANVPEGIFSGPGVVSSTGYFYPGVADTVNSPHQIYYTYINANGCTSLATALVFVLGAQGAISIPSDLVCDNYGPFTVNASNVAGVNGAFRLLDSNSQSVAGLTDHGDNSAAIDPQLLRSGVYTIEYQYFDEVTLYLWKEFELETISEPVILNLNEPAYCQNVDLFELKADIENVIFEGPGVTSKLTGFVFDPGEVEPGEITITCTAISDKGCTASVQKTVLILYAPDVHFTLNTSCIPDGGGNVAFRNLTNGKLFVETWSWNFDDPSSGADNFSELVDPEHFYDIPGVKNISLTANTYEGCVIAYELDTLLGEQPMADFTWINDCFMDRSGVKFLNRSTFAISEIDSLFWTFNNTAGDILGEVGSTSLTDTISFRFSELNNYKIVLRVINTDGCSDAAEKDLRMRPTIQLEKDGYHERFDKAWGKWTIHSEDQVESWIWDVPDFTGFTQVPGNKAWFTRLPGDVIDYRENSWIQSPCFDFSRIERPMIQMDIMRSFVPNLNGAVLQYQDIIEEGWKTVGEHTSGIGWYNMSEILNRPGDSNVGWGLEVFSPDKEWFRASHDLNEVSENQNVTFRIVIATNGRQGIGNQGFAIDNVILAERTKRSLLEHFTNSSDAASRIADDVVDLIGMEQSKDVIDIQYHTSYPGIDLLNESNPDPPSTRSFFYGIPTVPYAVLNGGIFANQRYDFTDLNSTANVEHILLGALEIPEFDIDLSVNWMDGSLEATTNVICRADQYEENIQLYMVVIESSITAYTGSNGDTLFRNAVLDMLPTPAGKLLGDDWYEGKSDSRTNTWMYKDYVEDIKELAVVAFVQDRISGRILQAAIDFYDELWGINRLSAGPGKVQTYPNPAKNWFYVNLETPSEFRGRIVLLDMNGKVVLTEQVPPGYQIYRIDIQHLNRGIYILQWYESDQVRGLSKIVKTE